MLHRGGQAGGGGGVTFSCQPTPEFTTVLNKSQKLKSDFLFFKSELTHPSGPPSAPSNRHSASMKRET